MKKVVAFLLALIIFVAPVTTLVKADVVIGDNDETIINENAIILGRKIALMESLSDLALSGVTEFTISNTSDVDSYLDSLWTELNDAIESLSDGTGFTEISNSLKSRYFTNLVQYKDYINNRGDYFANLLGNPTTTLLSTFFANNIFGKHSTLHSNLSLNAFRSLSDYRGSEPTPSPDPDFSFISNLNNLYCKDVDNGPNVNFFYPSTYYTGNLPSNTKNLKYGTINDYSYMSIDSLVNNHIDTSSTTYLGLYQLTLTSIYVNEVTEGGQVNVQYQTSNYIKNSDFWNPNIGNNNSYRTSYQYHSSNSGYNCSGYSMSSEYKQTTFAGLSTAINYIYQHYANVNLYVNNEPWAIVNYSISSPILDIDGYLKIYGNNNPLNYELQPNTQIDYDQLYQVIYNAIRDNLPISQGDINYYDSHDTIYSPTIINNYGEEEGDESDLIDTILDYAVIPKFDTSIAQPMRRALTNGVVIMNNSITNVIPDEILLILGACFFLLLFAVVINRMIK